MVNSKTIQVAIGVIINSQREVLLGLRPENTYMSGYWEFPGGKVEQAEDVFTALKRELHEELAIIIEDANPLIQTSFQYPTKIVSLHAWIVNTFQGNPHGAEGQTIQWMSIAELSKIKLLPANAPIVQAVQNLV